VAVPEGAGRSLECAEAVLVLNLPPEEVAWKEDGFVGHEVLRRKAARQRTWPAWDRTAAGHGDRVQFGRSQAGVITSRTPSPILRGNIAPCRMAIEYPQIGDRGRDRENWTGTACASWSGSRSAARRSPALAADLQQSYGAPPG
jgi:hypothetical protein